MKKRQFTIIELLVAITLTVLIVNILSTIYVRVSHFAVQQSAIISNYDRGSAVLDTIGLDFGKMFLPTFGPDETTSARLLSSFAGTTNYLVDITDTTSPGWPFLVFNVAQDEKFYDDIVANNANGISEVAYYCGPPLSIQSSVTSQSGNVDGQLLTLYRWVNTTPSTLLTSYFTPDVVDRSAPSNVLSKSAIYMAYVFTQGRGSGNIVRVGIDTKSDSFGNSFDRTPDCVDVIITLAPDSGGLGFSITPPPPTSSVTASVSMENYFENNLGGVEILADKIAKTSPFSWNSDGFFANISTGKVFYYRRSGIDGDLNIWSVGSSSGVSTIKNTDALVTGTTFKRRFRLK